MLETGSYTKENRRISRAIRLTFAIRRKLTARVLNLFLDYALSSGSEAHGRISAFLPKVHSWITLCDFSCFVLLVLLGCFYVLLFIWHLLISKKLYD